MIDDGQPLRASVVVATRDRAHLLARLLEALERQTLPRGAFEIIVVDDQSRDGTGDLIARFCDRTSGPFQSFALPRSTGPAAARNLGARSARGSIVAFTDDDCVPEADWLEAGLSAFSMGTAIVQGVTRAKAGTAGYGVQFSRTMEVDREDGHYPTCNIFYSREALERVGGFDESFRYACGEDTDLAWRVKAAGYDSRFCPKAVVTHDVRAPSFRIFLRERRRFAEQILLVKRHPHLRRFYYRRYFYQRSHVHAIAALSLIAAAGSGIWPAAALLPLVWLDRFRHTRLVGGWRHRALVAGELLVGDFWELIVFCYGSLRYRTLLI